MRRKIIITLLIILSLVAALWHSWGILKLAIIRATIHLPLAWWLQALLWGWE